MIWLNFGLQESESSHFLDLKLISIKMFSISLSNFTSVKGLRRYALSYIEHNISTGLIFGKPISSCKTIYLKLVQRKEESNFVSEISRILTLLVIVSLRISNLLLQELIFKWAIKIRLGFRDLATLSLSRPFSWSSCC